MLEHVRRQVPVTALQWYSEDVVLAGEGHSIAAYNTSTGTRLAISAVFDDQAIHGIIGRGTRPRTVWIWGGALIRVLRILNHDDGTLEFELGDLCKTSDWILDASCAPSDGTVFDGRLALVTAHNALAVYTICADSDALQGTTNPVLPGSNCILYCAHITWLSASQCLIASGTAFGDIIVWSATISIAPNGLLQAQSHIHFNFSAHDGSVFGVQLSANLPADTFGQCTRVLASCSDDRTIRLWDMSNPSGESPTVTQRQRETGFGAKAAGDEYTPPCLAKTMGHISRIWHVRCLSHANDEAVRVMSSGEDATNITWSIEPSDEGPFPYALRQCAIVAAHAGKHIWFVDVSAASMIASGGGDGAVSIRSTGTLSASIPKEIHPLYESKIEIFKSYAFVADGTVLATTDTGEVMIIELGGHDSCPTQKAVPLPISLGNYTVVTSVEGTAFIGNARGAVYLYDHHTARLTLIYDSGRKIAGLFAFANKRHGSGAGMKLLVTSVGRDQAALLGVMASKEDQMDTGDAVQSKLHLQLPPGFIVTSYSIVPTESGYVLVLGSRHGQLALYDLVPDCTTDTAQTSRLQLPVHGCEAVTSLYWKPFDSLLDEDGEVLVGHLHSTGRDGTHAVHELYRTNNSWLVNTVHRLALPLGPSIEGLGVRPNKHVWVWGFRSKHFVVYDVTDQRDIMTVDCGGAHRSFAFQPGIEGGTFLWTKASRLYQWTQTTLPHSLISPGGHGREIKTVAVLSRVPQIIATGAEDTNIKLWTFDDQQGFKCLQTLRKHNTGIQHLQWSESGYYLFSSGGFEEFYVWRIARSVPFVGIGVICESVHPGSGTSDLRIMSFEVLDGVDGKGFVVKMVYSDSSYKTWRYREREWALLAEQSYLTSCLTNIFSPDRSAESSVTMATDGHLILWEADEPNALHQRWTSRHKAHQNAILSCVTQRLQDDSQLVITGGDDNAIGFTRITQNGAVKTLLLPRAHVAAVTGLAIVRHEQQGQIMLASASIDQRVKLWQVDVDVARPGVDGINVKRLANVSSAVADVSSLETYNLADGDTGLLVCGVGMDILRVKQDVL